MVGGVDEAGAGPLAGPIMAGCVVLDQKRVRGLVGVDDCKKLTIAQREDMAERIKEKARAYAVAEASVEEIDRINILQAGLLAMRRAIETVVKQLGAVDHLLVDARTVPDIEIAQTGLVKGDGLSLSIAAASILAKVERDRVMMEAAETFPGYGFEKHKGYGTKLHLEALRLHGVTPLHRRSFAPVHTILTQLSLFP